MKVVKGAVNQIPIKKTR